MPTDPLKALENDPEIQAAHQDFEDSCTSEDQCWACASKQAIHLLANMDVDDPEDLALALTGGLMDGLENIADFQRAIAFLSDLARETAQLINFMEFHIHDDEE